VEWGADPPSTRFISRGRACIRWEEPVISTMTTEAEMGCPHTVAEKVRELDPVWVGGDLLTQVDIYFCPDCFTDFACKADTFEIVSPQSMSDEAHDNAGESSIGVYDGSL
jgi:hypothetical protein